MKLSVLAAAAAAALESSAEAASPVDSITSALRGSGLQSSKVNPSDYHLNRILGGSCTGTSYDFFLLVTQWDITECSCCFSCTSTNQFFTMHGLWPNDSDGDYPCNCSDVPFDPSAIQSIITSMNTYWLSLNGPSQSFWEHEWSKHGTCASDIFPDQLSYFTGALQARQKYDVVAALARANLSPSNTVGFTMQQFKNAVATAYGAAPAVQCDQNGNIETITQCLSKNMTTMACPSSVQDKCSASTLYLPNTAPSNDDTK